MSDNLGDYILSVHVPGVVMDPAGTKLDSSQAAQSPAVQAVLKMIAMAAAPVDSSSSSEESS